MDVLFAVCMGFPLPTIVLCIIQSLRGVWTIDRLWNAPSFDFQPWKCILICIILVGEAGMAIVAHRFYTRRYLLSLYEMYRSGTDLATLEDKICLGIISPMLKDKALNNLAYWETHKKEVKE